MHVDHISQAHPYLALSRLTLSLSSIII